MSLTLGELAARIGAELNGDPDREVHAVATLEAATAGTISFLANPRYRRFLRDTAATAVILGPGDRDACPVATLVLDNPYLGYARAASLLHPETSRVTGTHPSAVIDPGARIHESAWIGPHSVIEADADIAAGVFVGPGCVVGTRVAIGEGTRLQANVTVGGDVSIGCRTIIHPGVVIGGDGFGIAEDNGVWVKVPQLGGVVIGDDVEIGANTTIDRGALGNTVLGNGVKLDNQIQIAHNVEIGEHTAIAGCTGIAGSARIGRRCKLGGAVGVLGHLEITDDVCITAMSLVTRSITEPGTYSSGTPLQDNAGWKKNAVRFRKLDDMALRLKRLERNWNDDDGS